MGAQIDGYPNLDRTKKEINCQNGLSACRKLKIEPYISAKELADPEVESIAVMATIVQFKYAKPVKTSTEKAKIHLVNPNAQVFVGQPVNISLNLLSIFLCGFYVSCLY